MKFWIAHIALYVYFWGIWNVGMTVLFFPGESSYSDAMREQHGYLLAIAAYDSPALGAWAVGRLFFRRRKNRREQRCVRD